MSLKTGDFALIKYSCYDVNLGLRVQLLRLSQEGDRNHVRSDLGVEFWFVKSEDFYYSSTVEEFQFYRETEFVIAESCLETDRQTVLDSHSNTER
jgi:hypothetical protein